MFYNNIEMMDKIFREKICLVEPQSQIVNINLNKKAKISRLIEMASEVYIKAGVNRVNLSFSQILNQKMEREGTYSLYELALKRNWLFYMYKWGYGKKLLKYWAYYNIVPTEEIASFQMRSIKENSFSQNIGNTVGLKNGKQVQEDIKQVLNNYDNITSIEKRIDNMEFEYKFANVRDTILLEFMMIASANKEYVADIFQNENSDDIVKYVEDSINNYASIALGNIKTKINL